MKKLSLLITALVFALFIITSCGSGNSDKDNSNDESNDRTEMSENNNSDNDQDATDDQNNDKFYSKDGKFKITFPDEPEVDKQPVETELGKIEMVTYMYEESISAAYMVAYSDYPKEAVAGGDKTEMLNGAKNGFTNNLGLKITEEKKINLAGNQGVYFKAQASGYFTIVKDYLVENRLYQIAILRTDRWPTQDEENTFLNSFELVK